MGRRRRVKTRTYKEGDRLELQNILEPCTVECDTVAWKHPSYTFTDESGKVLACGGVILNDSSGEAWLNISKEASEEYKWSLCQYIGLYGALIMSNHGLESLYAYIQPDYEQGIKLAERFGFDCEGYVNGQLFYVKRRNKSWVYLEH